ncbi:MAG: EAL domain-containing protein [Gammaproteobacteria bacterium]|nr:EAL domain-containing protein [Gammaproteobacteria bacterium]
MPKFITLNSKIIFMLLASIVMVLALVGGIFSLLVTNLHEEAAKDELNRGLELLLLDLQDKQDRLVEGRKRLSSDEAILASVNLIWKYQKIDDYQPLLFDPEKETLAQILAREVQVAGYNFAVIYTAEGEVISFYDASQNLTGYRSYRGKEAVMMRYQNQGGAAEEVTDIPHFLLGSSKHIMADNREVHFRLNSSDAALFVEINAPLIKGFGKGAEETIGRLHLAYALDKEFVESIASRTGLSFAVHQQASTNHKGRRVYGENHFMVSSKGFDPMAQRTAGALPELKLNRSIQHVLHFIQTNEYFSGVVSLPLEESPSLVVIFGFDKNSLSTSLQAFQQAIVWVLLLSALLVIPVGVIFTRRFITRSIHSLVSYAESIGYGETKIGFRPDSIVEFNYLGESLQGMVKRLHDSQKVVKESEENVRLLLDSAGEGIFGIDVEGLCTFANRQAMKLLGYQTDEFVGKNVHQLIHHTRNDSSPYSAEECPIYNSFRSDSPTHIEGERFWCKDGSSIVTEYRAYPIRRDNQVVGSVVTFSDITERKKTESSLGLAKNIIESANEAILVTDLNSVIEEVNDAYVQITGYSREEAIGATPKIHKSGHHDKAFYEQMWQEITTNGHWEGEIWDRRKNGEIFPKWMSINTVRNELGEASNYVAIFSDITSLKETEKELENLAYYDALTELPNRVLLRDRLKQGIYAAKRDGHKVAVLLIDLDRFKYVNDTLGHDAGDQLLKIVARRLTTFVRESDTVARLGGDEFIIILSEINHPEEASIIAQKIIENLQKPIEVKGKMVNVGASIGIATYPEDGDVCDQLIKNSDLALYKAKDSGRNNYQYFSEELQSAIFDHIAMEDEMLKGIDGEQFTLHYQPKINLATNRVTGMEALVRWNHPEKGFVRPDHFIPFAEETGLIIPMGLWIFKTACRQTAEFSAHLNEPLKIAINLSAGQFQQRGLVYTIKETIERYGISPENVELEITESSVMGDVEQAIATMKKFRDLGLKLSIDDFGTGYSSLSYLKRFPINTLKIDQSFVRDLTIDSDDAAIVQAIISMAKNLNLDVVAEGVETEEQLEFLRQHGCENVQGYLLSKPLPADEFHQYIKKNLG